MNTTEYRGYTIKPKMDFPLNSKETGFVVTDGICNIMPGGTWFKSIDKAKRGIDVLIQVGGEQNSEKFWEIMQPFTYKLGQHVEHIENGSIEKGRFKATVKNHTVTQLVETEGPVRTTRELKGNQD